MLTRLKVSGFKNLVDVDVRFGPFTCIAGANGVGKSNLFDAIHFLSALADSSLVDAALSVRDEGGRTADLRSIFHRVGDSFDTEITFEVEMIVPSEGEDDLGQPAKATATFLRYKVIIAYRQDASLRLGALELRKEELTHITQADTPKHLSFPHSAREWRKSAVRGRRSGGPFISTEETEGGQIIKLHQDGGSRGRPLARSAKNLPRTVLSAANAAESPTALLARREMQSWRLLQLEPSALRRSDEFTAPSRLGADGSHLAATLYHLPRLREEDLDDPSYEDEAKQQLYAQVANRLSELIDDVYAVQVDRDERRELLTLEVRARDGTIHPARALSDGTLRFLALAILELDPEAKGLLCLEEPENGIHPERIPAMLRLLQDIAADVTKPVSPGNPLRQVIVNTHSPVVVSEVPDDSLLVAELKEVVKCGRRFKSAHFSCLPDTWRTRSPDPADTVSKGTLLAYLNPVRRQEEPISDNGHRAEPGSSRGARRGRRRVVDRPDLQALLPFDAERG